MTFGEADEQDAVKAPAPMPGPQRDRIPISRPAATASHVVVVPIPEERSAFVRYAVAVGATALALGVIS